MGLISKIYLILYNLSLTVGWAYVLFLTFQNRADYKKIYQHVRIPLQIFQTAAVLEILHAAIGIVKSNVILTTFQVFSSVFVVWGVLEISPPSTVSIGVPLLLFAWCVTEIIRYGYYFLNLIGLAQLIVWFSIPSALLAHVCSKKEGAWRRCSKVSEVSVRKSRKKFHTLKRLFCKSPLLIITIGYYCQKYQTIQTIYSMYNCVIFTFFYYYYYYLFFLIVMYIHEFIKLLIKKKYQQLNKHINKKNQFQRIASFKEFDY